MSNGNYWNDIFWRRMSRRRLLQTGAAAGIGLGIAAACGDSGQEEGAQQGGESEEAKPGGRLQYVSSVNFDGVDPFRSIAAGTAIYPRVYNSLLRATAAAADTRVFDLAQELEQPDEVTYVFKIRPGVKMAPNSLGAPERDLDANDALASYEYAKSVPESNHGAFIKQYNVTFQAQDASTFIVKTDGPYAWTLERLGSPIACIVPREFIQNNVDLKQQGAGGNAFFIRAYRDGEVVSVDRNPNYWNQPLPYLEGIDYRVITDRATWRAALLSQQVHYYSAENSREAEDLVRQQGRLVYTKDPSYSYVSFIMNPDVDPQYRDPRIRRAISRAINREEFINTIALGDARPSGVVHWSLTDYALPEEELNERYQPFDVNEAKQLLREAGHPNGITIRMMYPTPQPTIDRYVPVLLSQFQAAGIQVQQEPVDFATWLNRYRQRDYASSLSLNQVYETPETPLNWHISVGPIGDGSYTRGLQDPEVDAAVRKANTTLDVEQRIEAVKEAQRLIYSKDPLMLNIYTSYSNILLWNFVKNYRSGIGTLTLAYNDIWLDR